MADRESRFAPVAATAAAAITLLFAAAPALAQDGSLKDFLFGDRPDAQRRAPAPPVARYVSEAGEGFVLDRSSAERPLLRFEGSPEIWVLQPTIGPRGDIIYKNDLGQVLLRATRIGGLTLFTGKRPTGASAELAGAAPPVRLRAIGPVDLASLLTLSSYRASRLARHLVSFDAEATPESSTLIADAAILTVEAMGRLSRRPDGAAVLTKIRRVVIVEGARPAVGLRAGTLLVVVTPSLGVAGRPSSERIAYVTLR